MENVAAMCSKKFILTELALDPGVAQVALRAPAHRLVGLHPAEGVDAAGVVDHAGVAADAVEACLVHRAVGVDLASHVQWRGLRHG